MFRAVCWVMLVVLLAFCAVQYNDPDWPAWVALYGFAAAMTVLTLLRRYTIVPGMAALAYFVGFFTWMPSDIIHWLDNEEGREALGLFLCGSWMVALMAKKFRETPEEPDPSEKRGD